MSLSADSARGRARSGRVDDNGRMTQMNIPAIPVVPVGTEIASFENYAEAAKAVDTLADANFAVENLTIVGTDLKLVERVIGKLSWGRIALGGALSGLMFGGMFGLMMMLFMEGTPWQVPVSWMVMGAIIGAITYAALYAMQGGQRDFASTGRNTVATRYGLQCKPEKAAEATAILAEKGIVRRATPAREVDLSTPPMYGERVTDAPATPQAEAPREAQ